MTIDITKTYRTRDGREVRIYATDGDGEYCVHGAVKNKKGWDSETWRIDGIFFDGDSNKEDDLVPADPHGILPRHRELLASAIGEVFIKTADATDIRNGSFDGLSPCWRAALIALAKLDAEKGVRR